MIYVPIFLADGFEEVEAFVPADLLRRAGAEVALVSVNGQEYVTGSHGIIVKADYPIERVDRAAMSCVVLPGGAKGTELLRESSRVKSLIRSAVENGLYVAAICAAPSVLGEMGLLDGPEGIRTGKKLEHDDIFITAEGMGVAFEFGFRLVEVLFGSRRAEEIREQVRY